MSSTKTDSIVNIIIKLNKASLINKIYIITNEKLQFVEYISAIIPHIYSNYLYKNTTYTIIKTRFSYKMRVFSYKNKFKNIK